MTVSNVDICNMALGHIGNSQGIEDLFPNESTQEAFQCFLWYDHSREELLESFDWNFATTRVSLSLHATAAPSGQWLYRYTYPDDCVRARMIENPLGKQADTVPYKVEFIDGERTILTDMEEAVLVYTKNITNPALFSRKFIITLSYLIGAYIALPITGDQNKAEAVGQKFFRSFRSATGVNAQEGQDVNPQEAEWVSGRA